MCTQSDNDHPVSPRMTIKDPGISFKIRKKKVYL